jgi:hypothetical protein
MAASAPARRRHGSGCLKVLRAGGAPDNAAASLLRQADGISDGAPIPSIADMRPIEWHRGAENLAGLISPTAA